MAKAISEADALIAEVKQTKASHKGDLTGEEDEDKDLPQTRTGKHEIMYNVLTMLVHSFKT